MDMRIADKCARAVTSCWRGIHVLYSTYLARQPVLQQRARFTFRPDKGVNHRGHHGTNDDTQGAIANFHQVVHRAKTFSSVASAKVTTICVPT